MSVLRIKCRRHWPMEYYGSGISEASFWHNKKAVCQKQFRICEAVFKLCKFSLLDPVKIWASKCEKQLENVCQKVQV